MLTQSRKTMMLVIALLLFIPIGLLQTRLIDPFYKKNYAVDQHNLIQAGGVLPAAFALGAFSGFREAIAGLLWVRTDEFFHSGDYDAINPMIRIITWLDPHQIDVYETGAWHMDYNFTDSQERSDRRYIPMSIALINEGIKNNPDEPDLYADKAFVHYFRKIEDYPPAAAAFLDGWKVILKKVPVIATDPTEFTEVDKGVMTVGHGLAHAYEFSGNVPAAIDQWHQCIDLQNKLIAVKNDFGERQDLQIAQKQLYELQSRIKYRPIDTKPPVDMQFNPQLVRIAPKEFVLQGTIKAIGAQKFVMETGERTFGSVDGTRIEIRLEDQGYKMPIITNYDLSSIVDPNVTIMQDAASVRDGKIGGDAGKKLDMSQDPTMYPFKAQNYTVTVWFSPNNPNDAPIQVQDRIGWMGEGMTDKRYLVILGATSKMPGDATPISGLRLLEKTYTLTRADILGQGRKVFN